MERLYCIVCLFLIQTCFHFETNGRMKLNDYNQWQKTLNILILNMNYLFLMVTPILTRLLISLARMGNLLLKPKTCAFSS